MTVRSISKSPLAACVALAFAVGCSSEKVDFFAPGDGNTGGVAGTAGDSANGGSADAPGTGGSDTAGTGASAGSSSGGGGAMGGTGAGGDAMGGTAGDGMGGDAMGGMGGDAMGGTAGDAMGGTAGDGMGGTAGDGSAAAAGMAGSPGAGAGGASTGGSAGTAGQGGATGGVGGSDNCVPVDEVCDGLDNDCNGTPDDGSTCPASCTGNTYEGHVYILCSFEDGNNELSWAQANARCADRDLLLVQIDDEAENGFLVKWIEDSGLEQSVWMGANDLDRNILSREGMWVWGTGSSAIQFWMGDENGRPVMSRFNAWASGEPDNGDTFIGDGEDCGSFDPDENWEWDDDPCSSDFPNFICESAEVSTR